MKKKMTHFKSWIFVVFSPIAHVLNEAENKTADWHKDCQDNAAGDSRLHGVILILSWKFKTLSSIFQLIWWRLEIVKITIRNLANCLVVNNIMENLTIYQIFNLLRMKSKRKYINQNIQTNILKGYIFLRIQLASPSSGQFQSPES